MEVLHKILRLLKEQNKKQMDLTNYLGISKNAVTNWKIGDNKSYMKHLPKIAEFFDVSVDYLLGKESPNIENSFTYALYDELAHDLSGEQLEQLKQYADFLRSNNSLSLK